MGAGRRHRAVAEAYHHAAQCREGQHGGCRQRDAGGGREKARLGDADGAVALDDGAADGGREHGGQEQQGRKGADVGRRDAEIGCRDHSQHRRRQGAKDDDSLRPQGGGERLEDGFQGRGFQETAIAARLRALIGALNGDRLDQRDAVPHPLHRLVPGRGRERVQRSMEGNSTMTTRRRSSSPSRMPGAPRRTRKRPPKSSRTGSTASW